jgi:hypothetical protein
MTEITKQQLGKLYAMCKQNGTSVNYGDWLKLSSKEASDLIDDMVAKEVKIEPKAIKYSGMKLGMAQKLVTQYLIQNNQLPEDLNKFTELVKNLLRAFDYSEWKLNGGDEE